MEELMRAVKEQKLIYFTRMLLLMLIKKRQEAFFEIYCYILAINGGREETSWGEEVVRNGFQGGAPNSLCRNEIWESGVYYSNARYYDAIIGRFINVDPVQDGSNWYVYCSNNPLSFVDPTGLEEKSFTGYFLSNWSWDNNPKVKSDTITLNNGNTIIKYVSKAYRISGETLLNKYEGTVTLSEVEVVHDDKTYFFTHLRLDWDEQRNGIFNLVRGGPKEILGQNLSLAFPFSDSYEKYQYRRSEESLGITMFESAWYMQSGSAEDNVNENIGSLPNFGVGHSSITTVINILKENSKYNSEKAVEKYAGAALKLGNMMSGFMNFDSHLMEQKEDQGD